MFAAYAPTRMGNRRKATPGPAHGLSRKTAATSNGITSPVRWRNTMSHKGLGGRFAVGLPLVGVREGCPRASTNTRVVGLLVLVAVVVWLGDRR